MSTPPQANLPNPEADAVAASEALCALIANTIRSNDGWISFSRYMELALYAPGLGYYSGGAHKFGAAGDFVTSPELTPLFAHTLARQVAQVMAMSAPQVLEAGGGSGALATDLLLALEQLSSLPEHYFILELSGELRARQAETLNRRAPHLAARVAWLDTLPETFSGCVVGNEVLDAMPVQMLEWTHSGLMEKGVALEGEKFIWASHPATPPLALAAQAITHTVEVVAPYQSEINPAAAAWVASWGERLSQGALILLDYGFPRHEYYHAQRSSGTLMCHYRHHSHDDPFWWPGLNDITAHVDFTAMAEAGFEAGLEVAGYLSQAAFLMNCGLTDVLAAASFTSEAAHFNASRAVAKLINPAEMGELFKVIAFSKNISEPLLGFALGDKTHTL